MIIKASKEKSKANPLKAKDPLFIKSSLFHRRTIAGTPNPVDVVAGFVWFSTSATGGAVGPVGCFIVGSSTFDMFLEFNASETQQRTKLLKK